MQLAFEKFYSNEQNKIIDWLKQNTGKNKYVLQVVKQNNYSNYFQTHIK